MTAGLAILLRTEDMDLQIWNVRWGDGLRGQWERKERKERNVLLKRTDAQPWSQVLLVLLSTDFAL